MVPKWAVLIKRRISNEIHREFRLSGNTLGDPSVDKATPAFLGDIKIRMVCAMFGGKRGLMLLVRLVAFLSLPTDRRAIIIQSTRLPSSQVVKARSLRIAGAEH